MTLRTDVVLSPGSDLERQALTGMHRLFRYPAKFHGPLARALLEEYAEPGSRIIDPFCGSGTLMVEASLIGRYADGVDVDPLAVFVASAKCQPYDLQQLEATYKLLSEYMSVGHYFDRDYEALKFKDISEEQYFEEVGNLAVPQIPNIFHWFRRYSIVDLARILSVIETLSPEAHKPFFKLCFASVIRLSSNADPIPVSGLEVTSHMKRRDAAGRLVKPSLLFDQAVRRSLKAIREFQALPTFDREIASATTVMQLDTTTELERAGHYDLAITSPPYHGAVDYYRRHALESYWLGLLPTRDDRLKLLPHYLGRVEDARGNCTDEPIQSQYGQELYARMTQTNRRRANSMMHYCQGMQRFFEKLHHTVTGSPGQAILVVGDSRWSGELIDTTTLLAEIAQPYFTFTHKMVHRLKNRYMSYSRHNSASIEIEHILGFEKI